MQTRLSGQSRHVIASPRLSLAHGLFDICQTPLFVHEATVVTNGQLYVHVVGFVLGTLYEEVRVGETALDLQAPTLRTVADDLQPPRQTCQTDGAAATRIMRRHSATCCAATQHREERQRNTQP